MKPSHLSYGFLLSFLGALFVLQWWQALAYPWWLTGLLGLLAGLGWSGVLIKRKTILPLLAMSALGILVALLLTSHWVTKQSKQTIGHFVEEKVEVTGRISTDPEIFPNRRNVTIDVRSVNIQGDGPVAAIGRILVTEYVHWPVLEFGDEVKVLGTLKYPEAFNGFAYDRYLAVRGIGAVMQRGTIELRDSKHTTLWDQAFILLYRAKRRVIDQIGMVFPEPHSSLLTGLLIGADSTLPKHLKEDFRIGGISHILAVSGYNVTILLLFLGSLLFFIPIKLRILPLGIALVLFVLITGAEAPVVRAGIMGLLGLIAISAGRLKTSRLLLLWTAFLMLLWNPSQLWYDPGFQLSFLATLGIGEIGPFLKNKLKFVPTTLGLRESLAVTLAALLFTFPISVFLFRQISLVAPLTNILVAPLIPLAMLLGALATVLSALWLPLGLVVGYVGWLVLEIMIRVAELSAAIPHAVISF